MKKQKTIATILTAILFLSGMVGLFVFIKQSESKVYTSFIAHQVTLDQWGLNDRIEYYWSEEGEQNASKFIHYPLDTVLKSVTLTYDELSVSPKTVYLHVRLTRGLNVEYKVFRTKDYFKAPADIQISTTKVNQDKNYLGVTIIPNSYSGVQKVFVQMSDNSMLSKTPKEKTQYKLIYTTELNKPLYPFELKINLDGLNILDGQYYFKVTTIDASHNITVRYSGLIDVDMGVLDSVLRFDSLIIGPDGQIIRRSPVFITGNTLVLANADSNSVATTSTNTLVLVGKDINDELFDVRYRNGKSVDGLALVPADDRGGYFVSDAGNNYNDWYYVYYDNEFCGVFLYQKSISQ